MGKAREVLRLKFASEISGREIAAILGMSNSTVSRILERAAHSRIDSSALDTLTDPQLQKILYPHKAGPPLSSLKVVPDFEKIIAEIRTTKKLTVWLCWSEYKERYGDAGYGYSWFSSKIVSLTKQDEISMRQNHIAGEMCFVDYAGTTVPIWDKDKGKVGFEAEIFVATLAMSGESFIQAHRSTDLESFLLGHRDAFLSFGGVPAGLRSDNLRSAVVKNTRQELELNRSYLEFCRHYGVIPSPARPFRPKDKAKV